MYNPMVGRWMEEDPIEFKAGDVDLYRYVGNNPSNLTDPSGLRALSTGSLISLTLDKLRPHVQLKFFFPKGIPLEVKLLLEYVSADGLTRWQLVLVPEEIVDIKKKIETLEKEIKKKPKDLVTKSKILVLLKLYLSELKEELDLVIKKSELLKSAEGAIDRGDYRAAAGLLLKVAAVDLRFDQQVKASSIVYGKILDLELGIGDP